MTVEMLRGLGEEGLGAFDEENETFLFLVNKNERWYEVYNYNPHLFGQAALTMRSRWN
jgi:hypothetical protein